MPFTVSRFADSNVITSASAAANILPNGPVYNTRDYSQQPYKTKIARSPMYQNGGMGNKQVSIQPQQQVVVPVAVPQPAQVAHPGEVQVVPTSQMNDLLNQVHALTNQLPKSRDTVSHLNNHVSKVSIGNTKETNINNIKNSVAPITSKSITSQDVGPKSSHVGNHHAAYHQSPVNHMMGDGNYHYGANPQHKKKTHATDEQRELKARLLALASKATANSHSEPVLRYNQQTGVLEKVPVDPNASLYKDKLHQALEVLNPKKLPTNKLKRVLEDDDHHPVNPYSQIIINQPVGSEPGAAYEPEPEYVDESVGEPAAPTEYAPEEVPEEAAPLEKAPTREDIVNQIRFELDDRLNRISDLLYFRPEFMNQLLQIDDPVELTPVEGEFKRMVLCNSDEQFCGQDLANWTPGPAGIEHVPEEGPAPEAEPEPVQPLEEEAAPADPTDDDDLVDDGVSMASPSVAQQPRKLARKGYQERGSPERAQVARNGSGRYTQQQQPQRAAGGGATSNARYPTAPARLAPASSGVANNRGNSYVPVRPQRNQPQQQVRAAPRVQPQPPMPTYQQQARQPQMQPQMQPQLQAQLQPQPQPQRQFQRQPQRMQTMSYPPAGQGNTRNGNAHPTLPSSTSG